MTQLERAERDQVVSQVLAARTLPEVDAAERVLAGWLAAHPADIGMEDGFEQLANTRDAATARVSPQAAGIAAEDAGRPA